MAFRGLAEDRWSIIAPAPTDMHPRPGSYSLVVPIAGLLAIYLTLSACGQAETTADTGAAATQSTASQSNATQSTANQGAAGNTSTPAAGGSSRAANGTSAPGSAPPSAVATPPVPPGCNVADTGQSVLTYNFNRAIFSETLTYGFQWTCSATERVLTANGVPNHPITTGRFAAKLTAQSISETFPMNPDFHTSITAVQSPGYGLNGVLLHPGTTGTCLDSATSRASGCSDSGGSGTWRMEALPGAVNPWLFDAGIDANNANTLANGQYRYLGVPVAGLALLSQLTGTSGSRMLLAGWAKDGFPIYIRYGHVVANDPNTGLRSMLGSYRVKSRPDLRRPAVSIFPMGHFQQDWEYVAGLGDLDECNGRIGVTPEFPEGTYHYFVTDTYPFIQRCVKGKL